ncbi:MAG: protoheme IX farnesyltransferase [Acidobacteriales bacterium]|nr:protoheme IX farnesyltransferase [Terriglobales bacterium]
MVAVRSYAELLKLRVTVMVVATAWAGYYLGCVRSLASWRTLDGLHAMLGIGLASGGAAALNQVLEKRQDALMQRTRRRPIPSGALTSQEGAIVGSALIIGGCIYLAAFANVLAGLLTLFTAVMYVFCYTPLKTRSPWATFIGAIPGAMPPLLGWAAARGAVEWQAIVLFAILFVWQFPHFQAIAWLYREDYSRAGILMLPVARPDGRAVAGEVIVYAGLLVPVSLLPTLLHMTGLTYFIVAIILGLANLYFALQFARIPAAPNAPVTRKYARQLLRASVMYLPVLYGVMMWNALQPVVFWDK